MWHYAIISWLWLSVFVWQSVHSLLKLWNISEILLKIHLKTGRSNPVFISLNYNDRWFEFTMTICCGTLILHNNSSLVRLFLNARPAHLVLLELHDAFLINFLLWEQYGLLHHREQLLPRKVFQLETGEDRLISAVLILGIPSQEILEPFASGRDVSRRPIRSGVAIFRVKQQDWRFPS